MASEKITLPLAPTLQDGLWQQGLARDLGEVKAGVDYLVRSMDTRTHEENKRHDKVDSRLRSVENRLSGVWVVGSIMVIAIGIWAKVKGAF